MARHRMGTTPGRPSARVDQSRPATARPRLAAARSRPGVSLVLPAAALLALSVAAPTIGAASTGRDTVDGSAGISTGVTGVTGAGTGTGTGTATTGILGTGARLGAELGGVGAGTDPTLTSQITEAIRTSQLTAALPAQGLTVTDVRVSATDPSYAAAHVVPPPDTTDPASALLRRSGGRWTLVEIGTAGVGCDTVSPAVRADLSSVLGLPCL
jgi:hypothetical protein